MEIERGTAAGIPWAATGPAGDAPPVVLLAGLSPTTGVPGDGGVRMTLAPVLGLAGSRRLVMTNRRAGLPRGLTMTGLAGETADALRELGAPVDLVGVSTGGSIAQQVAAEHPDVVRRLVLASTGCRLGPEAKDEQLSVARSLRAGRRRRALADSAGFLVPRMLRWPAWASAWLLAPLWTRDPLHVAGLDDLATTAEAEDGFDLARCPTITAPTLLVGGGKDRFYPQSLYEQTAALIPGARLRIFPGRGHVTVLSDDQAKAAITDFLSAP